MSTARSSSPATSRAYVAGVSSTTLNAPRSGRNLAPGKKLVSEVSSVIRGTSKVPGDSNFVHFHIKRRITHNTNDTVITSLDMPNSMNDLMGNSNTHQFQRTRSADAASTPRGGTGAPYKHAAPSSLNAAGDGGGDHLTIGGRTFDVPDKRMKKPVASPKRKQPGTMKAPKDSQPSQVGKLVNFQQQQDRYVHMSVSEAAQLAANPEGRRAMLNENTKSGKAIPKQGIPKQDCAEAENQEKRFTKPPYWDEHSRPPQGHELARPTHTFKAPRPEAVAGAMLSPNRTYVIRRNESVVGDCLGLNAANKKYAIRGGVATSNNVPSKVRAVPTSTSTSTSSSQQRRAQTPLGTSSSNSSVGGRRVVTSSSSMTNSGTSTPVRTGTSTRSSNTPSKVAVTPTPSSQQRRTISSTPTPQKTSTPTISRSQTPKPTTIITSSRNVASASTPAVRAVGGGGKVLLQDHDQHCAKGFDSMFGRKRCMTPQPVSSQTRVRAPTLANPSTNCFRLHPLVDHRGKSMNGNERKTSSSEEFHFGGNFAHSACQHRLLSPGSVGRGGKSATAIANEKRASAGGSGRSSSAPAISRNGVSSGKSSAVSFKRSDTSSSLLEAPFDRTCNPGKPYDPTFDSRTCCRVQKSMYTRPVLKAKK